MSDSQVFQAMRPVRLHPTTEAVYRFIIRYKRQHAGDSPTRREICAGVGISGPSTVHHHLAVLQRRGRIELPGGKARMIMIPGASWSCGEDGDGQNGVNQP